MSRSPLPLLMLAEGRRPRLRRPAQIAAKELAIHMGVADVLRRFAKPDWRWSHFPAGELRDISTARKLKQMGLMPGWPDFILLSPKGRFHALELKRIGESLSEAQRQFELWCFDHKVHHATARCVNSALKILAEWGALRINIRGVP